MYNIALRDYEGFSGFGLGSAEEVDQLNKALTAGYQNPQHDGGGALRVQSLEETMRVLAFSQKNIKFWKDITKLPAFSTIEEYTLQLSYGVNSGAFTREGELPQTQDASYQRKAALVKYLGTQREVTHPMMLVRPAHGNVIALETRNGAIWLLRALEKALFHGRSDIVPEEFDGIDKLIQDDPVAQANNVIDLRGGPITEDVMEEATNIVVESYGEPDILYCAPRALSDLSKQFYPKERIALPAPREGRVGLSLKEIDTNAGVIGLKPDIFLRSANDDGRRGAPTAATANRAPTAPTVAGAAVLAATGSKFVAGDVGTFQYKVTALNRFGETAGAQEAGGVAVAAAGDAVDLTITDGGGSDAATGYGIYRSKVGGAAGTEELIAKVARPTGAATTVWRDLNLYLPGTSRSYLLQNNVESLAVRQLAPMMKIPLATLAASIRWMQLIYLTLIVYAPRKNVILLNVADS